MFNKLLIIQVLTFFMKNQKSSVQDGTKEILRDTLIISKREKVSETFEYLNNIYFTDWKLMEQLSIKASLSSVFK